MNWCCRSYRPDEAAWLAELGEGIVEGLIRLPGRDASINSAVYAA